MFSLVLLCVNLVLFCYILIYGVCFVILPFVLPTKKNESKDGEKEQSEFCGEYQDITVLVPCHHEGPGFVNTIESLLSQDYPGHVEIVVLFKDDSDSSFKPLREKFSFSWRKKQREAVITERENRRAILLCTGLGPKKDKLNSYLPKIESPFIAFLDADHRAKPNWLSRSVQTLGDSSYAGVQSRRAPLSLKKLPQLWDGAQNHIGNELVSVALKRIVGSVFFTGTTCVFRSSALKGRTFGDCVTEDTYLSYELLADAELITYCSDTGSNEEVAPDFHSYIARRRRWSCGHNKTFFSLIGRVLKAPVSWRAKAATFIHGLFYTVPVAVCLLLNMYALHLFIQYTWKIRLLILLLTFVFSSGITLLVFGRHKKIIREILVLALWIGPQLILLAPHLMFILDHELYFFLSPFPYVRYLFWPHALCLLAPILLLLIGSFRIRLLQVHQLFLMKLSYPLFFFLDLWACLLGFSDYLLGRPTWAKIQRTHEEDLLEDGVRASSFWVLVRWFGSAAALFLLAISINNLTADSNCGEPEGFFFHPKLKIQTSEVEWSLDRIETLANPDTISVTFQSAFSGELPKNAELLHFIDGVQQQTDRKRDGSNFSYSFEAPLGWDSHEYDAVLRLNSEFCRRSEEFTTTLKQLKDKKLFINGEEFFVKGVIPSFSTIRTEISREKGLTQIKQLGANALRYYHSTRQEVIDLVEKLQLLIIDQPHRSTWDDVDLTIWIKRDGLAHRFRGLVREFQGFPYSLFHTLGNELEIRRPAKVVPKLKTLMNEIIISNPRDFFAYSTYFVFLKLPAAIYGVNMLDSSDTYWSEGLKTVQALNKPFYASEFGGFVASRESTPPALRAHRLFDYYDRVSKAGGFGIVIHQSHDNWSQPVIENFNDPLTPDHPDDLRGLWDHKNKPKPIKRFIEQLFSDFEYHIVEETLAADQQEARLQLKNSRPYELSNVELHHAGSRLAGPISFLPGETHEVPIRFTQSTPDHLQIAAHYSTHHGLSARSQLEVRLPRQGARPVVLNRDYLSLESTEDELRGTLLHGGRLEVVFPERWKEIELNGKRFPVQSGRNTFPLRASMEDVVELERSSDGENWIPATVGDIGTGPQRVRFKLRRNYPKGAILLLAGLGTEELWIKHGNGEFEKRAAEKYRENLIELDSFAKKGERSFTLLLPRFKTIFIEARDHPLGEQVGIDFELPRVFSPAEFELKRVSSNSKRS